MARSSPRSSVRLGDPAWARPVSSFLSGREECAEGTATKRARTRNDRAIRSFCRIRHPAGTAAPRHRVNTRLMPEATGRLRPGHRFLYLFVSLGGTETGSFDGGTYTVPQAECTVGSWGNVFQLTGRWLYTGSSGGVRQRPSAPNGGGTGARNSSRPWILPSPGRSHGRRSEVELQGCRPLWPGWGPAAPAPGKERPLPALS
jgi:hypothetical protein